MDEEGKGGIFCTFKGRLGISRSHATEKRAERQRNVAQGCRLKGIEHQNHRACLRRRPFGPFRNPNIAYRWSETIFRRRLRSHATDNDAERTAKHRARAPAEGKYATKPTTSLSPSTISAKPQPLHCLTVVGGHVLPPPTLACDQ